MPIEITMPRLSDTMESGTIIKWNVKEGDRVSAGQAVADIETDKATMEMQVYDDGTVARLIVAEGQTVDVGTVIALVAGEGEDARQVAQGQAAAPARARAAGRDEGASAPPAATGTAVVEPPAARDKASAGEGRTVAPGAARRASPLARHMAEEHGIDVGSIQGSGPGGRVIKRDVLNAIETGRETAAATTMRVVERDANDRATARVAPAAPDRAIARVAEPASGLAVAGGPPRLEDRIVPLSNIRQTIARRLVESKTTIPHYQVTVTFDMDHLLELRTTLNEQLEKQGVALKLSVNDFLVRACALAMHEHHEFNASFQGDSVRIHGAVNVGVAIALPPERGGGLVVACIRQADLKSLRQISSEVRTLADKARTRGLSLEDMADTTFTISNLGMFGVEHFTAIINPPNSAILAVGAALQKPVVRQGELRVGHEMSATLSLDHRVIDGAMAARYLQSLKSMIEHPSVLLV